MEEATRPRSAGVAPAVAPRRSHGAGPGALLPSPHATNSWARRTILARAHEVGLPADKARQAGNAALWYYNRLLLKIVPKDAIVRELPFSTNRYLVPITLCMGCQFVGQPVDLGRLLRLSGTPTERTVQTAHDLFVRYSRVLSTGRSVPAPVKAPHSPRFRPAGTSSRPTPPAAAPVRPTAVARPKAAARLRPAVLPEPAAPSAPARPTSLALPMSEDVLRVRRLFDAATGKARAGAPPDKPRQVATNAWARKRIADRCRNEGLPDRVSRRSLDLYERIVDLHSAKAHAPAGKRLQLSPRLNWSLVYTTIYLGCRIEEFPRDLHAILGANARPGSVREVYRLYRFYKRELNLNIPLLDVKTFIQSWLDGFELSDLMHEELATWDARRVQDRAIAIADKARTTSACRGASTKLLAAGALTTALAERRPPGTLSAFYRAIATFLHMSEEMIRVIVGRIAQAA